MLLQSVMTIYNAVLTGQRVLFVGHNHAAGHVCKIVLAACALVSPPIEVTSLPQGAKSSLWGQGGRVVDPELWALRSRRGVACPGSVERSAVEFTFERGKGREWVGGWERDVTFSER